MIAVGLAAASLGLWIWNDEARRIDRRLAKLCDLAGKSPTESQLQGAAKANAIADVFAADFELIAEPESYATSNRQDLIRGIMTYRSRSRTLVVDVLRKELFVDPGGLGATHYAYLQLVNDLGDLVGSETYPVRVEWAKQDGKWFVRTLEVLEPGEEAPL